MNRLLTALMLLTASIHFGQLDYNSPYSEYALGDFRFEGTVYNQSMGGVGVSNGNALYVNKINPAMLTRNKTMIFDLGVAGALKEIKNENGSSQKFGLNFDGVFLGFPITNKLYTAVGITPYSSREYSFTSTSAVDDSTTANNSYSGNGGVTKISWSTGYKFYRAKRSNTSISAGLEIDYLFGPVEDEASVSLNNAALTSSYYNRQSFSGFAFVPGLLLRKEVKVGKGVTKVSRYNTESQDTVSYFSSSKHLFSGKVINNAASKMVEGRYLVLFGDREDVIVSSTFGNSRTASYFRNAVKTAKPYDVGVYIKSAANEVDRKTILQELEVLLKRYENGEFLKQDSVRKAKKYAQRFVKRSSGVFVNMGAVFGLETKVNAKTFTAINQSDVNGGLIYADTIDNNSLHKVTMPSYFKLGFSVDKPVPTGTRKDGLPKTSVWSLAADYSHYDWRNYNNHLDSYSYKESFSVHVGGEICPDITQIRSKGKFAKAFYRLGAIYRVEPYEIGGNEVRSVMGTVGMGIPVYGAKQLPRYINLQFGYGQRGSGSSALVQESYYNFAVSVTFNNKFVRRKEGL